MQVFHAFSDCETESNQHQLIVYKIYLISFLTDNTQTIELSVKTINIFMGSGRSEGIVLISYNSYFSHYSD